MPGEQNANAVRRNREIAARVRRLAEVVAQLAVEYEARPEPDAMEDSALVRLDSESDNYVFFAVSGGEL